MSLQITISMRLAYPLQLTLVESVVPGMFIVSNASLQARGYDYDGVSMFIEEYVCVVDSRERTQASPESHAPVARKLRTAFNLALLNKRRVVLPSGPVMKLPPLCVVGTDLTDLQVGSSVDVYLAEYGDPVWRDEIIDMSIGFG